MERIKQALEKARQERLSKQGTTPPPAGMPAPARIETEGTGELQTRTVTLDEAVLKENRIIGGIAPGPFTESFNLLRTQVLQRFKENDWNVLAVTSPGEGEGKTLTAINLAISIAREVDYTVVLVDANLRHPWMLKHFGLPPQKGLSDFLMHDVPIAKLLIQSGHYEHLAVLPGGSPLENSAEMLNSPKMTELVKEMKSRYHSRVVIFDLPPVLSYADALAFSPYVDAALLVVEEGVTRKEDVEAAIDLLSTTNIVGTVLNKGISRLP